MYCSCGNIVENRDTGLCASCASAERKAERQASKTKEVYHIPRKSAKQSANESKYNRRVSVWKKGKVCQVKKCGAPADDCHHSMGKIGYADEWARENDITLFHDERFWVPLCRVHHTKATADSVWAWENEVSFKRVTDPIFRKR